MLKKISTLLVIVFCFCALIACSQKDTTQNIVSNSSSSSKEDFSSDNKESTLQQGNHYPLTLSIYDDSGNKMEQTIEKEPQRIVVIGQGIAEWMIGLGEEKRIVGLAYLDKSFSKFDEQIKNLPIITDMWPSKESILELEPDLIISMSSAFQKDRIGDISFWNERGIPVLAGINYTIGRTIDGFFDDINNLGNVLNIEEKTNAFVNEQKEKIRVIQTKAAQVNDRPRVLLLGTSGETTYYYAPSLCLIDEMIEGAGGEYIQVSEETYVEMSEESILSINPDKIIIAGFQKSDDEELINKYLNNPKLKNATAIKTGNVQVFEYTTAIRGSLDLANMYMDVAKFIHPELFKGE